MKLVQVNVTAGRGSTGVIAQEIGNKAVEGGWESWIAYGREPHRESASQLLRIGSDLDVKLHGLQSRLLDNHGLASRVATRRFIRQLQQIKPDIVHLHNIHGYYLNYPILFKWLKDWGGPVVWTLHDIWPITGHCAYFGVEECMKWRTGCHDCERKSMYPASMVGNRSCQNFELKKNLFTCLPNLTLVPVSDWLSGLLAESIMAGVNRVTIHNGVDTGLFAPCAANAHVMTPYVLCVAGVWTPEKGLDDIIRLRALLEPRISIVVVGVSDKQKAALPAGIVGLTHTADRKELAMLYAGADAFVNPTYGDNFPTVNIEALACGTPVITYRTGGSPEAVDERTGVVVERGDVAGLAAAVERARRLSPADCRARAMARFNKDDRYGEYIELYNRLLHKIS